MDPGDPNVIVAWALDSAATVGSGGIYRTDERARPDADLHAAARHHHDRGPRRADGEPRRRRHATCGRPPASRTAACAARRTAAPPGPAFQTGGVNFCNPQCFYDIAVAAHPTVANTVHLGGSPTLVQARSTDGGATFTTNGTTAVGLHVDTHVIAYAPSDPNIMYFGSDGGIYRSTDSGTTWTSRNNTQFHATQFQSLALHPTDREFMIGGTQDNGTISGSRTARGSAPTAATAATRSSTRTRSTPRT